MALRREVDLLRGILERRERAAARLYPRRVEGRSSDGSILLRDLRGECVERGSMCSAYQGQIIEAPCGPPLSMRGASGVALQTIQRTMAGLWVEALDPALYEAGQSYTVTVSGWGFLEITELELLAAGSEVANPDITITDLRVLDAETIEIDIDVTADAATIAALSAGVGYQNPGVVPRRIKPNMYGIGAPPPPEYLAVAVDWPNGDLESLYLSRYAAGKEAEVLLSGIAIPKTTTADLASGCRFSHNGTEYLAWRSRGDNYAPLQNDRICVLAVESGSLTTYQGSEKNICGPAWGGDAIWWTEGASHAPRVLHSAPPSMSPIANFGSAFGSFFGQPPFALVGNYALERIQASNVVGAYHRAGASASYDARAGLAAGICTTRGEITPNGLGAVFAVEDSGNRGTLSMRLLPDPDQAPTDEAAWATASTIELAYSFASEVVTLSNSIDGAWLVLYRNGDLVRAPHHGGAIERTAVGAMTRPAGHTTPDAMYARS